MVEGRLRAAAANQETFYGLLAAEVLGEQPSTQRENVRPDRSAWRALEKQPNVRAAMALAEIDEDVYAGAALRHQAQIGDPRQHARSEERRAGKGSGSTWCTRVSQYT